MQFDFDTAAKLAKADPEAFELYRQDLIADLIESLPLEKQGQWWAYQNELDLMREQLSPEDFQRFLFHGMANNVENLGDKFMEINHLLREPPVRPAVDR
jgi:hypothetical protein